MACPISIDVTFDCSNLPKGGLEPEIYLYNKADYDGATITRDGDGNITNIVNGTGLRAYKYTMPSSQSILVQTTLRTGTVDMFDHSVQFLSVNNTQAGRNEISKMRFAQVVAIVLRKDGTGVVYGDTQALVLTDLLDTPNDPDLGGVIQATIATDPDIAAEPDLPVTIFITDATTTRALVRGLTTPGV